MNCSEVFLHLKKPYFSLKKNLFSHFHKTSFVDILQTILSNKVPIFSSCGVTLYICRKKEQEKHKSCIRGKKIHHISSKNIYTTRKDFPLSLTFYIRNFYFVLLGRQNSERRTKQILKLQETKES